MVHRGENLLSSCLVGSRPRVLPPLLPSSRYHGTCGHHAVWGRQPEWPPAPGWGQSLPPQQPGYLSDRYPTQPRQCVEDPCVARQQRSGWAPAASSPSRCLAPCSPDLAPPSLQGSALPGSCSTSLSETCRPPAAPSSWLTTGCQWRLRLMGAWWKRRCWQQVRPRLPVLVG